MENIPGSTTKREGLWLYQLALAGPGKGVIVEIGSFLGRSTIYLARGSKAARREKVYAIDPHLGAPVINHKFSGPTYKLFLGNIRKAKVNKWVVPIKKTSAQARSNWKLPIRLLFIDGDHSIAGVKRDLLDWEPLVSDGGVIALHDAVNPGLGPIRGIVNVLLQSPRFSHLGAIDSMFFCVKIPPQGLRQWLNWYVFSQSMKLINNLLSAKVHGRIMRGIQQYIVKRWLKRWLIFLTRLKL